MDYLLNMDGNHQEEKKLYATLFDLLSFEKIAFSGKIHLQFPSPTVSYLNSHILLNEVAYPQLGFLAEIVLV